MIYLRLFLAYLQIGLFSIGGGHASIPVAEGIVVRSMQWLTQEEFTAMITISEMTPGPFGLNSATYVGLKAGGFLGGLISTVAFLVPSFFICIVLYVIIGRFRKLRAIDGLMNGIRPAVSGIISSAGVTIFLTAIFGASTFAELSVNACFDVTAFIIAVAAFILLRTTKINPVIVILISGVFGIVLYSLF